MIEILISKFAFACISIYNLYRNCYPFSLVELSIILLSCCFVLGWMLTIKRFKKIYETEGYVTSKENVASEPKCFEDNTKAESMAWMLEVDNKFAFLFKALYWFSFAYIHSLFIFLLLVCCVYTYMIFANKTSASYSISKEVMYNWTGNGIESLPNTSTIPALFGMRGMFVFFDSTFILMHVSVFIVSFLVFYVACIVFLKREDPDADAKTIMVNRQRFQYLFYIAYIFVDMCYTVFEVFMMLSIHVPKDLETALDAKKREAFLKVVAEIKERDKTINLVANKEGRDSYKDLKAQINSLDKNISPLKPAMLKILSMVQKMPNRDALANDILK